MFQLNLSKQISYHDFPISLAVRFVSILDFEVGTDAHDANISNATRK